MQRKSFTKRLYVSVVALFVALFSSGLSIATVSAACLSKDPDNDIMRCGTTSRSDFIAKTRENSAGDLKAIYAHYGLAESDYDRFSSSAKSGKSSPNGDIKVDGKVVATGGHSLGRNEKTTSSPVRIGLKVYHESKLGDVTKYENDVLVLFDGDDQVEFVVMNICGNPIRVDQPEEEEVKEAETKPVASTKPAKQTRDYPKIEVQKTVGESRNETISANEGDEFTYYIVVKNTGDTKLTEIKIYDKPSTRITFQEASEGSIKDNVWTHTISSLESGAELEFTVKAKLTGYNSFSQINKVCVDAKELSAEKDDCDSAWVKPTKQEVKAATTVTPVEKPSQKKGDETPVAEVPKTGPAETLGAVLGLGSLAGAGYYWRSGRHSYLKSALLGK